VCCLRALSHLGEPDAQDQAWHLAIDPHVETATRQILLGIVGETGEARFLSGLLRLVDPGQPENIRAAALEALELLACRMRFVQRCGHERSLLPEP
jgi:hypothetical protein